MKRTSCWSGSLVLLCVLPAGATQAQEIAVDVLAGRGDRAEFRTVAGMSARVGLPLLPFVRVGVAYTRHDVVSDVDDPGCGSSGGFCFDGSFENDIEFATIGYEIALPLSLGGFDLAAAVGMDVTTARRHELRRAESGQIVEVHAAEPGLLGSLFDFNGRHVRFSVGKKLFGLPLSARASYQRREVDLRACSDTAYAPFCDPMNVNELLLGLSFSTN